MGEVVTVALVVARAAVVPAAAAAAHKELAGETHEDKAGTKEVLPGLHWPRLPLEVLSTIRMCFLTSGSSSLP